MNNNQTTLQTHFIEDLTDNELVAEFAEQQYISGTWEPGFSEPSESDIKENASARYLLAAELRKRLANYQANKEEN